MRQKILNMQNLSNAIAYLHTFQRVLENSQENFNWEQLFVTYQYIKEIYSVLSVASYQWKSSSITLTFTNIEDSIDYFKSLLNEINEHGIASILSGADFEHRTYRHINESNYKEILVIIKQLIENLRLKRIKELKQSLAIAEESKLKLAIEQLKQFSAHKRKWTALGRDPSTNVVGRETGEGHIQETNAYDDTISESVSIGKAPSSMDLTLSVFNESKESSMERIQDNKEAFVMETSETTNPNPQIDVKKRLGDVSKKRKRLEKSKDILNKLKSPLLGSKKSSPNLSKASKVFDDIQEKVIPSNMESPSLKGTDTYPQAIETPTPSYSLRIRKTKKALASPMLNMPDLLTAQTPSPALAAHSFSYSQKEWKKNILILLKELSLHKHALVFISPVKKDEAPLYYQVIKNPLSISFIRSKVKENVLTTTDQVHRDLLLMLYNALVYNGPGAFIYSMALELIHFVNKLIKDFKTKEASATVTLYSPSTSVGVSSTFSSAAGSPSRVETNPSEAQDSSKPASDEVIGTMEEVLALVPPTPNRKKQKL